MSDARAVVLGRIRAALADQRDDARVEPAPGPDAGPAAPAARATPEDRLERFVERVADYRATVTRVAPDGVAAAVAQACERHGARRLLVPEGLPAEWLPAGVQALRDSAAAPLERDVVAGADGALTTCALAVAETGSIVLDAGAGQGRRVLTLLPDLHICVVDADGIVDGMPQAFARLAAGGAARRPLTFVSGPSATSDIELKRVEGVHGPRRLEVVVAVAAA